MNGIEEVERLRAAGFTDDEIAQWAAGERGRLVSAGFSEQEVGKWFGEPPEPNLEPVRKLVRGNLAAEGEVRGEAAATKARNLQERDAAPKAPIDAKPVRSFDDALSAGLQMSVSGLIARGKAPTQALPADPSMAQRVGASIGQTVGDLPFMMAGAVLGGAGGAVTGPGALATAGAGAFGLPAGLRATLMDAYERGSFKSFGDFWERASGIVWETVKGEITGAATAVSGGAAKAATAAAPAAVRALAPTAAEITTMTAVGHALEGEVPSAQDFLDAAVVVGGLKVATATPKLAAKLRSVYAETGTHPRDVVALAAKDPTLLPTLLDDRVAMTGAQRGLEPRLTGAQQGLEPPQAESAQGGAAAARGASVGLEPSPAQRAVLDRISVGELEAGEPLRQTWDRFYTYTKDDLHPVKRLVDAITGDQALPTAKDPYRLARLTRGVAGKAQQFLDHAPFDFNTYENVGKPLREIVEPVKADLDGLRSYAVARRALELERRGIETGVPAAEARQVVAEGGDRYAAAFAELVRYQDNLVKYLADSGVLSADQLARMREANRDYVPFFRLTEEQPPDAKNPGLSVRSPVKLIEGGTRRLIDPLESIIKNTYAFTSIAERNAVGRALVDLWEQAGRPDIMRRAEAPHRGGGDVGAFLEAHGIEAKAADFDALRPGAFTPSDTQIAVFRNGVREVYEVPPEVAAAFNAVDRESAHILTQILAVPAKALRAGATLAPEFMLRNVNRDQLSAAILSDNGYVPVLDFMRGLLSLAKKDDVFQAWLKSGGANATMLSMDRRYLQQRLDELREFTSVRDRAWNIVKSPIEALRIASELAENATRLGEFKRATAGDLSKASAQAAGFGAREVTLDFARIGAQTRGVNMITAFWNAQVEGFDRTVRAFHDHPFRTSARVAAYITLPSVLLWWANHDDPRWKEIPQWERDVFWIVMTKEHVYRIPKPFELGILFGSVPERLLDKFAADRPDAFAGFARSVWNTFGLNMIPTAASPILEHVTNHSFFTDRPLIPKGLENLLPEYQYTAYTTEATKALGHMIGAMPGMRDNALASPAVIDNYVRGWTGTLGGYAVQIADAALRKAGALPDPVTPAKDLADMPVIKAFMIRYPSAQAQSIQDFYDHYESAKKITDTVQYLARHGDPEAAMKVMQMDPVEMLRLEGIHDALGNAHRLIQLVYKNPSFSADEKRQIIDTTYMQMIEMARSGEKALRGMKRVLEDGIGRQ